MSKEMSQKLEKCSEQVQLMEARNADNEIVKLYRYFNIPIKKIPAPIDLDSSDRISQGYIHCDEFGNDFKYDFSDITEEELQDLKGLYCRAQIARKESLALVDRSTINESPSYSSFASKTFNFLAWFLWIGGLFASIALSIVSKVVEKQRYIGYYSGYETYSETVRVFDWVSFCTLFAIYIVCGILCKCIREVIETLNEVKINSRRIPDNEK